jgi:hypothetical protein
MVFWLIVLFFLLSLVSSLLVGKLISVGRGKDSCVYQSVGENVGTDCLENTTGVPDLSYTAQG